MKFIAIVTLALILTIFLSGCINDPTVLVEVRVVDKFGNPVEGASLSAFSNYSFESGAQGNWMKINGTIDQIALTGKDGKAAMQLLPGNYAIKVSKGTASNGKEVFISSPVSNIVLVIKTQENGDLQACNEMGGVLCSGNQVCLWDTLQTSGRCCFHFMTFDGYQPNYFACGQTCAECLSSSCFKAYNTCFEKETNVIMSLLTANLRIGAECPNDTPTVSIAGGAKESALEIQLEGKPIGTYYLVDLIQNASVVYDPNNSISLNSIPNIVCAKKIKFLIPNETPIADAKLLPNQTTVLNYKIVKKSTTLSSYFIATENSKIDFDGVQKNAENIKSKYSAITGLNRNVSAIYGPRTIMIVLGAEGNLGFGDSVSINYGDEETYKTLGVKILVQEFAHEYAHSLQTNMVQKYKGDSGWLIEGSADGLAIYSGFRSFQDVGFNEAPIPAGCQNLPFRTMVGHDLGRCIFKHLQQSDYLSDEFFKKVYNPEPEFDFSNCSLELTDVKCTKPLKEFLQYATGKDMGDFMQTELGIKSN
ncbi:MAG: hypothetical protein HY544_02930 [Candidatus Diapherotrites archaeon]|uniref:Uncharacterized protein n=1 Tax=Candidatus Iainarchaeum sp. TaxID=3101447 RepID=A0A8T3YIS7_9ARCH|nr:hypothetical protein [Candidatus Diapherotrites archaeon]